MKGSMQGETFECKEIVLKCPSKYTDEEAAKSVKMTETTYKATTE